MALPIELGKDQWAALLTEYIQTNFVAEVICADVAIHDTDGHNPHAHIMLTVRPLDEQGRWQYKTEKEYLCIRDGEERGFTAAEFKAVQADGWEKQYQYKVGKKKVYMAPSAAETQNLVRVSKHPKSTKYGRQNPIAEKWNSDEQIVVWRKAWADTTNAHLERAGADARIDHRSHAERGLDVQPTIHEGVIARALEKKGIIADRCEINRQIKADNALLRELKVTMKKLMQTVKNTLPAMAEKLETLRQNMIIFQYQFLCIAKSKGKLALQIDGFQSDWNKYVQLIRQIKAKSKERKSFLTQKKDTSMLNVAKHMALAQSIAELTEEIEELKSEKVLLLHTLNCDDAAITDLKKNVVDRKKKLKELDQHEQKYVSELDSALQQYRDIKQEIENFDSGELMEAQLNIRSEKERIAIEKLQEAYGKQYDSDIMLEAKHDVAELLHEESGKHSVLEFVQKPQEKFAPQKTAHREER